MKMINIIKLTLITLLASIILAGCGGGGSDASFENTTTTGVTAASCSGAISTWTTVTSGDVVSATDGSQLKFDHDSSNNKKVCVVSGSATIL